MAEYIEREKAFKLIKEQKEKETGAYSKGRNKGLIIAGSIINNKEVLPTADVEKVVHGEWLLVITRSDYLEPPTCDTAKCSICGFKIDVSETTFKHCPDCGAKMDGGKAEGLVGIVFTLRVYAKDTDYTLKMNI